MKKKEQHGMKSTSKDKEFCSGLRLITRCGWVCVYVCDQLEFVLNSSRTVTRRRWSILRHWWETYANSVTSTPNTAAVSHCLTSRWYASDVLVSTFSQKLPLQSYLYVLLTFFPPGKP